MPAQPASSIIRTMKLLTGFNFSILRLGSVQVLDFRSQRKRNSPMVSYSIFLSFIENRKRVLSETEGSAIERH
jgi:hypothetical protein